MKVLPAANPCSRCGHELCARKVALFSSLEEKELAGVLNLILRRRIRKGESVFREGEPSESLIIVNQGSLKVHTESQDGREQILYLLQEGEFIGDLNLLKPSVYTFSGTALEDTRLCVIRKADFDSLLRTNPDISLKVLAYAHERISALEALVQTLTLKEADARLALFLKRHAEKRGTSEAPATRFTLPLSREEIASATGLTRETVSRKLNQLIADGVIALPTARTVEILDAVALEERCQSR